MFDYISFGIQAQIIKWLPVKSLIRFRCVSKTWKTLIESSKFIVEYYLHNTQQQQKHLLIRYSVSDSHYLQEKYISFVDDDNNNSFPIRKHSVTVPVSVKSLDRPNIVTSKGLFCFYNFCYTSELVRRKKRAVIWNPLITKFVNIKVPNLKKSPYANVVGFWVCHKTSDIKLVKITCFRKNNCFNEDFYGSIPWKVEVFTLSSGVWRSPVCRKLPRNTIELTPNQVDIDRFVYWHAFDAIVVDYELEKFNLIMSFDMITEEFIEIRLPRSLAQHDRVNLVISKLKESLVVLKYESEGDKRGRSVWMMEDAVSRSFKKLFTINMTDLSIQNVLGFRRSGEVVIVLEENDSHELCAYEPYSKSISYIHICRKGYLSFAGSYKESLLLLDQ